MSEVCPCSPNSWVIFTHGSFPCPHVGPRMNRSRLGSVSVQFFPVDEADNASNMPRICLPRECLAAVNIGRNRWHSSGLAGSSSTGRSISSIVIPFPDHEHHRPQKQDRHINSHQHHHHHAHRSSHVIAEEYRGGGQRTCTAPGIPGALSRWVIKCYIYFYVFQKNFGKSSQ